MPTRNGGNVENDNKPKECRAIKLARKHVQNHELIGCDGLQDRMVTFDYYARHGGSDSEEFQEAARRFIEESRRVFLPPDLYMPREDEKGSKTE